MRRCLALAGAILSCALVAPASAKPEAVFTISNYPVEASDSNAVVAKEKALADGQRAAFRSLLKRIVPVTAYKQLKRIQPTAANDLLSGVAVRSERNSSTQYIANLDYSFQADAVRTLLSREGIAFVDKQAEPVTIVTVMREGNPPAAKNDAGWWREAWVGLDLVNTLTPLKLDTLKPAIHNDTVNMLMSGDESAMRILNTEYKTEQVVFAIAEPDLANKKLIVTLSGRDAVGPLFLKRTYRVSGGDVAYSGELASVVALGVLEGRWKTVKAQTAVAAAAPQVPAWSSSGGVNAAPGAGNGQRVSFVAEFSGIGQWNEIRTQLLDTPGVDNVEISTMSARDAQVALSYPGGMQGLANALGGRGLSLTDSGNGWVMRSKY